MLPNCGGVIGLHDTERRARLVRMLADELVRRQRHPSSPRRATILAIDGLGGLLASVAAPGDVDEQARLLRVLTDGPGVGIHTVATLERAGGVPHSMLAALGQRWLFHVDDPLEGAALGVGTAAVPPPIPGRIVVVATRLEAQLAVLPVVAGGGGTAGDPPLRVEVLDDDVDGDALAAIDLRRGDVVADGRHRLRHARPEPSRGARRRARPRRRAGAQWADHGAAAHRRRLAGRPPRRHRRAAQPAPLGRWTRRRSSTASATARAASSSPSTTPNVSPTPMAACSTSSLPATRP